MQAGLRKPSTTPFGSAGDGVPARRADLTTHQFGFLTVKSFVGMGKRHALYLCECRCGRLTIVCGTDLTSLKTRSCGKSCPYKPERFEFQIGFRTIEDGRKI
jgi:hypothetical protein